MKQEVLVEELQKTNAAALRKVTQSTISGWEGGKVPGVSTLVALADFYGVELRWLATGQGTRKRQDPGEAEKTLELIRLLVDPARPAEELHALLDRGAEALTAGKAAGLPARVSDGS